MTLDCLKGVCYIIPGKRKCFQVRLLGGNVHFCSLITLSVKRSQGILIIRNRKWPFLAALRSKAAVRNVITSLLAQDVITMVNGIFHYVPYSLGFTLFEPPFIWGTEETCSLPRKLPNKNAASGAFQTLLWARARGLLSARLGIYLPTLHKPLHLWIQLLRLWNKGNLFVAVTFIETLLYTRHSTNLREGNKCNDAVFILKTCYCARRQHEAERMGIKFLVHHWGCDWEGLKYLKHQYYKPFYSLPMEAVK